MRNINIKLFLVFTIFFVIPLMVFGLISYLNYFGIISEQIERSNIESIDAVKSDMKELMQYLDDTAFQIRENEDMWNALRYGKSNDQQSTEYLTAYETIIQTLRNILIENNFLDSVYLYMQDGSFYYANYSDQIDVNYSPQDEEWFISAQNGESESLSHNVTYDMQTVNKDRLVIPYICSFAPSSTASGEKADIIVFNMGLEMVKNRIAQQSSQNGGLYVIDGKGAVIFSNIPVEITDTEALNDFQSDKVMRYEMSGSSQYMANIYNSKDLGWIIVSFLERQSFSSATDTYPAFILIFLLLFVVLMIIITAIISNELAKPIKKLELMTKEIASMTPEQQYNVEINVNKGLLAEHFNSFSIAVAKLVEQLNTSLNERQEQERYILEAQINPHFIYNTLNSIRWQAINDGNKKIEDITRAIINLFKKSLKIGQTYIYIKDELEQIKDYISIQMFKRGADLQVEYDVDPSLSDCMTLKFILQPIVENSIFHGFSSNQMDARLEIKVKRDGNDIAYTISDNGRGMTEKELDKLFANDAASIPHNRGIGIANVNERIKKYFGTDYGVAISSSHGTGTTVRIRIPMIKGKDVESEKNQSDNC
jgi:two-component system sensor histidine kinase YesM